MANHILIACRPDHPVGYGYTVGPPSSKPGSWSAKAHGYSTLLVPCDDEDQVELVRVRLLQGPILLPFRNTGGEYWYGGMFDFIATVSSKDTVLAEVVHDRTQKGVYSLGDNRAVTIVTARDVLRENAQESMRKLQEFNRSTNISNNP